MPTIPKPHDGKGAMMTTGGKTPRAPAAKLAATTKGAPAKGSGSDTSPYSSAAKGSGPRK